jgi:hypothetical protein
MECDKSKCHFYKNGVCDSLVNQIMKVPDMKHCPSYRTYVIAVGEDNIKKWDIIVSSREGK